MDRPLQNFIAHVARNLLAANAVPPAGVLAAKRMAGLLENVALDVRGAPADNPLTGDMDVALRSAGELTLPVAQLVPDFIKIADQLPWYRRPSDEDMIFDKGHINAEIIGPEGLVFSDAVKLGVTVMSPGVTFPDHHHPPEEVYVVLSPGYWRQNDEDWWSPGPGGYVYNPPDILHAMKSEDSPLFALWCLDLKKEN